MAWGCRLLADAIDPAATIAVVAGLTALSGLWVAVDLPGPGARRAPLSGPKLAKP